MRSTDEAENRYTPIRRAVVKWILRVNLAATPLLLIVTVWRPGLGGSGLLYLWLVSAFAIYVVFAKERGIPGYSPMFPRPHVPSPDELDDEPRERP